MATDSALTLKSGASAPGKDGKMKVQCDCGEWFEDNFIIEDGGVCSTCKAKADLKTDQTDGAEVALDCGVMPPLLAEILKTFPLRQPDRSVSGGDCCNWLLEWHNGDDYFEIEYSKKGEIEIMTMVNGETKHWTLKGA